MAVDKIIKGKLYKSTYSNLIVRATGNPGLKVEMFEGEVIESNYRKIGAIDPSLELCFVTEVEEEVEELEIGQKVEWTVGSVKSEGAVLECKGEFTEVMTHYIGRVRSNREIEVLTELLIKID